MGWPSSCPGCVVQPGDGILWLPCLDLSMESEYSSHSCQDSYPAHPVCVQTEVHTEVCRPPSPVLQPHQYSVHIPKGKLRHLLFKSSAAIFDTCSLLRTGKCMTVNFPLTWTLKLVRCGERSQRAGETGIAASRAGSGQRQRVCLASPQALSVIPNTEKRKQKTVCLYFTV